MHGGIKVQSGRERTQQYITSSGAAGALMAAEVRGPRAAATARRHAGQRRTAPSITRCRDGTAARTDGRRRSLTALGHLGLHRS